MPWPLASGGDEAGLKDLLAAYEDEGSADWLYTRARLACREGRVRVAKQNYCEPDGERRLVEPRCRRPRSPSLDDPRLVLRRPSRQHRVVPANLG
jgi:hypothetical protein